MKAIETKAQVDADCTLTITIQVPADVQSGEYEAMVVLNRLADDESSAGIQVRSRLGRSILSVFAG